MIKRILLATDGSENSKKAMDFAIDMAGKYEAILDFIHVIAKPKVPPELMQYIDSDKIKDSPESVYFDQVAKKIMDVCGDACSLGGVKTDKIRTSVLSGDPAEMILEYSKTKGVEVIIMGSRGLGGIAGRLLGSVSRKVTHYAECTCIIVK